MFVPRTRRPYRDRRLSDVTSLYSWALDTVVCGLSCAGLPASVSGADRGVATQQSDEFDVILVLDVRPAAAAAGGGGGGRVEAPPSRRSAVHADRRQGRDRRRTVNVVPAI